MQGLIDRIKPKFQSNLHSFGQWLLYPQGWQIGTLDADNPIYVALGGTDANPAIPGFNPGQSADTLYVTNGETTDYADTTRRHRRVHAGARRGRRPGAGFVFPDDEALIQAEFEKTLPFHLGLARSARRIPTKPDSPVGHRRRSRSTSTRTTSIRRTGSSRCSTSSSTSPTATRRRCACSPSAASAPSTLRYQVNGGRCRPGRPSEWNGGERYGPGNEVYYHVMGGQVTGTDAGRQREGVVHRRRRDERLVHLHGRSPTAAGEC